MSSNDELLIDLFCDVSGGDCAVLKILSEWLQDASLDDRISILSWLKKWKIQGRLFWLIYTDCYQCDSQKMWQKILECKRTLDVLNPSVKALDPSNVGHQAIVIRALKLKANHELSLDRSPF